MRAPARRADGLLVLAWVVALCVAVTLLTLLGDGPLGLPSILDPTAWRPWAASRDAVTMAFAALRGATLVAAWYLLGATVVGVVARWARSARLVALADLLTVPAVRRLLQSALGVGFAAAALTAGSPGGVTPPAPPVAAASLPPAAEAAAPDAAASDVAQMTPLERDSAVLSPLPPPVDSPATPAASDLEWTVRPGEHFWSIAEHVLRERGAQPRQEEVATYWERLVAANRSRLSDPSNPDLIYPGQTLRLPSHRA